MKRMIALLSIGTLILTGCSSQIKVPRLDGTGIDSSAFTRSEEKFSEELSGKWCYDCERPNYNFEMYTTSDGAKLAFDEKGRVVRFRNTPEVINAGFIKTDELPVDKINKFLDDTLPHGESVKVEPVLGETYDGSRNNKAYYDVIEEIGDKGWFKAEMNGDGTIQQADFDYFVPEKEVDVKKYDKEADAIIKECTADGEGSIQSRSFIKADGQIYGSYSILTGFKYSEEDPVEYGTYVVLVRPDHDDVSLKKTY